MQSCKLVTGKKEELLAIFNSLKEIHGRGWRSMLRRHNPWHDTTTGMYAWENASKGTAGNETLRLLIDDMRAVTVKDTKRKILKKHGFSKPQSAL